MRYKPLTREQADAARAPKLIPPGTYNARVMKCEEATSKAGKDMLALWLEVYAPDGVIVMRDWIVNTDTWAWKLRHLCEGCGIEDKYATGTLHPEDLIDRSCAVEIKREEADPDSGRKYPQNRIEDYKPQDGSGTIPTGPQSEDDIPF